MGSVNLPLNLVYKLLICYSTGQNTNVAKVDKKYINGPCLAIKKKLKSSLLKWIPNGKVKYHIATMPFCIGEINAIDNCTLTGRQIWFYKREPKVGT